MISKKYFEYQNLLVHFARVSGNHKTPRQSAERSARHIGWYKPDGAEVLMGRESMQMILQMAEEMKFGKFRPQFSYYQPCSQFFGSSKLLILQKSKGDLKL